MKKIIIAIVAIIMMVSMTSCGKKEEPMYTLIIEPYNGYAIVTVLEEGADFGIEYKVFMDTIKSGYITPWTEISAKDVETIVEEYIACRRNEQVPSFLQGFYFLFVVWKENFPVLGSKSTLISPRESTPLV